MRITWVCNGGMLQAGGIPRERGLWESCCKVGMIEVVSGVSRHRLVCVGLLCLVSIQFFRL